MTEIIENIPSKYERQREEFKRLDKKEEEINAKFFKETGYERFISPNDKHEYTNPMLYKTSIPLCPYRGRYEPKKYYIEEDFEDKEYKDIYWHHSAANTRYPDNFKLLARVGALRPDQDKWEILSSIRPYFIHERVINRLYKLCPNDFQAVPAELVPTEESKEKFLNTDYYGLHMLCRFDVLDIKNCVFWDEELEGMKNDPNYKLHCMSATYRYYHDDKWDGHYFMEDNITRGGLWHPRAAWELRNARGFYMAPASGAHSRLGGRDTEVFRTIEKKEINRMMKEADKLFT